MFGRKQSLIDEDAAGEDVALDEEESSSSLRGKVHTVTCFVLAAGNVGFGLLASVQPSKLAPIMQEDESRVRAIGARDLASGVALFAAKDRRWPLMMSIRSDLFETISWARSKPKLAIVPALWCGMAVLALVTRPKKDET
jgi:hypothetical protein